MTLVAKLPVIAVLAVACVACSNQGSMPAQGTPAPTASAPESSPAPATSAIPMRAPAGGISTAAPLSAPAGAPSLDVILETELCESVCHDARCSLAAGMGPKQRV